MHETDTVVQASACQARGRMFASPVTATLSLASKSGLPWSRDVRHVVSRNWGETKVRRA